MKQCIRKPLGYYFVCVTPENKQQVLELVEPWEIVDVEFSTQNGREIYTLIHKDPEYNVNENGGCPWMWGFVGDYLLRDSFEEFMDQDEPEQVSANLFKAMFLPVDCGLTLQVTTQMILDSQKDYCEWDAKYGQEEFGPDEDF